MIFVVQNQQNPGFLFVINAARFPSDTWFIIKKNKVLLFGGVTCKSLPFGVRVFVRFRGVFLFRTVFMCRRGRDFGA